MAIELPLPQITIIFRWIILAIYLFIRHLNFFGGKGNMIFKHLGLGIPWRFYCEFLSFNTYKTLHMFSSMFIHKRIPASFSCITEFCLETGLLAGVKIKLSFLEITLCRDFNRSSSIPAWGTSSFSPMSPPAPPNAPILPFIAVLSEESTSSSVCWSSPR